MSVAYRQGREAIHPLRGASLTLGAECAAVMGPSGRGKSTLLRVLAGLQRPDSGHVLIDGRPVGGGGRRVVGDPRVSLIHQDYRLVEFLTVAENLSLAAELRAITLTADDIAEVMTRVGMAGYASRYPLTLSGGEQQRVAIARALVSQAEVILADEPTGALDDINSLAIAELLVELTRERGVGVLIATHDRVVAERMERVVALHEGRLHEADLVSR